MSAIHHTAKCRKLVYPCGPEKRSVHFPYIRNCLKPARFGGLCWQHAQLQKQATKEPA